MQFIEVFNLKSNFLMHKSVAAPRQKSARIAKIREKEEQERRELEAIRLKQLAEENRLREIKKKAREERRVRLMLHTPEADESVGNITKNSTALTYLFDVDNINIQLF